MNREKLEQTLRKVIEDRNARSLGERSEIYSAARSSVRKATNEEPAVLADVDDVIEAVEASFTPAKTVQKDEDARPGRARRLPALLAGVVLGGAATAAALVLGLHFRPYSPIAAKLMQQYEATAPLVPTAVDYLHKVRDAVVAMQKSDPAALEAKASKKFITVASLDAELWKQFPKSMPSGSRIVIRANRKDYKILFNWTLCGAAQVTVPAMVEPIRTRSKALSCPYFGLWTPGAAKW